MNKVRLKLRYDRLFMIDLVGKASGLAVMWRNELQVCKVLYTDFNIEMLLERNGARARWWLICVYVSSEDQIREK